MQEDIIKRIEYIKYIEEVYDKLAYILDNDSKLLNDDNVKMMIQELSDYYFNGEWLKDYELDENNHFPKDLKRAVLSEDAIYNLLCDIKDYL